jgi:predicted O-methyltransferase YrrM
MLITPRKRLRQLVAIAETANVLFLKLLFRNRKAAHHYPGVLYREYLARVRSDKWRSAGIFELFPELPERSRVVLEHLPGEGLRTSVDELAYLALATRALAPSTVFEIGTFRGRTALNFALNSPPTCRVYTLDLPIDHSGTTGFNYADSALVHRRELGRDYAGTDVAGKIHQLLGDSREFDFAPFEGKVDLVFIDGGHTYEVARSDTENALRICRHGGAILWHDFGNYGDYGEIVRAALDCLPGDEIYQIENTQLALYRKR